MQKPLIIAASLLATATLFAVTPGVALAQARIRRCRVDCIAGPVVS